METNKLAIVIPAYNESESIESVIKNVSQYGTVIVVDDCSTDGTGSIAEENGAVVVSQSQNMGYDGALNSGFSKASELGLTYAITFDADGQHDHRLIPDFYKALQSYDVVVGCRPKQARLAEYVFSFYTRFKYNLKDPLCGMKGYNLKIYTHQGFFDSYKSIGTQLAIFAIVNQYAFFQFPIPIHEREGRSKFGGIIKANRRIFVSLLKTIKYF